MAVSWVSILPADLRDAKVAALVDALASAALGEGQSDPTAAIIADVTFRLRAEVKGCRTNVLHADTTLIPESLKSLACRMIVRQMQSRLQIPLTTDEQEEQRNDLAYLKRIAACEVPIDSASEEGAIQSGTGTPRITPRHRDFSRRDQSGV